MDYTNPLLKAAILKEISNQRKNDKFSICYKIGMMVGHCSRFGIYSDSIKRAEVIEEFTELINNPKNLARLNNGHCLSEVFNQFK